MLTKSKVGMPFNHFAMLLATAVCCASDRPGLPVAKNCGVSTGRKVTGFLVVIRNPGPHP